MESKPPKPERQIQEQSTPDESVSPELEARRLPLAAGAYLINAAKTGDEERAHFLIDQGAEINVREGKTQLTALHYAAAHDARNVLLLIASQPGCDFTLKDVKGRTAADLAYEVANNPVTARYLLMREFQQRRSQQE